MKFAYYKSLIPEAKKAFDRGTGNYKNYIVVGKYLFPKDKHGQAKDSILIIKNNNPVIKGITK
jgi:hypothetical protein